MNKFIYRVIDANFNRLREGLRVREEFVRFSLNDKGLTEEIKKIRNKVSSLYNNFPTQKKSLISAREVNKDVGKAGFAFEKKRPKALDIFWANLQRSKEALRVLEEFCKLGKRDISDKFRKLRFKTYELEKRAFKKLRRAP